MKELQHGEGTILLDDRLVESLERLGDELARNSMSAVIRLSAQGDSAAIEFSLGGPSSVNREHRLRAKPATGEGSHFPLEEI